MLSLEYLPGELQIMVLRSLSLEDLDNCVRASKTLYETFRASPSLVAITDLGTRISPAARSYAITLQHVADLRTPIDAKTAKQLLRKTFARKDATFPQEVSTFNLASLMEMDRRHRRLMKFIRHFASFALSTRTPYMRNNRVVLSHDSGLTPPQEPYEGHGVRPYTLPHWAVLNKAFQAEYEALENDIKLTPAEITRLQRAFYAHELYCHVVPICPTAEGGSLLSKEQQYTYFWKEIPPFQAEEIACIHHYFMCMAGTLFDQIELELVQDFIAASLSYPESTEFIQFKSEVSLFYLYPYFRSDEVGERPTQDADLLASKGTEYCQKVLEASKDVRLQLLRDSCGLKRVFIPSALEAVEFTKSSVPNEWHSWYTAEKDPESDTYDWDSDSDLDSDLDSVSSSDSEIENSADHCLDLVLHCSPQPDMDGISTEPMQVTEEPGVAKEPDIAENTIDFSLPKGDEQSLGGRLTAWARRWADQSLRKSIADDPVLASKGDLMLPGEGPLVLVSKGWLEYYYDYYDEQGSGMILDSKCRAYRDLGYVFWNAKRLGRSDLKSMVSNMSTRYARWQLPSWPRSELGADSRLCGISVSSDAMAKIIQKYCPTALLSSWPKSQSYRS